MSASENQQRKLKKRGPYFQYLADGDVKIPKVTKWRNQNYQNDLRPECDAPLEENFDEENISLLHEVDEYLTPTTSNGLGSCASNVDDHKGDLLEPEYPTMLSEFHQLHDDDPAISVSNKVYDNYADDDQEESSDSDVDDNSGIFSIQKT